VTPVTPFAVPRGALADWLKPSHACSTMPGFYYDLDGEYDIGVFRDMVIIYPRKRGWQRPDGVSG
jgi:hypothetical protein